MPNIFNNMVNYSMPERCTRRWEMSNLLSHSMLKLRWQSSNILSHTLNIWIPDTWNPESSEHHQPFNILFSTFFCRLITPLGYRYQAIAPKLEQNCQMIHKLDLFVWYIVKIPNLYMCAYLDMYLPYNYMLWDIL